MGTRGRQIVGLDVDELLKMLNAAYASEWLAYYQYWLGAKLIKGPMKDAVAAELNLHATEELGHATLLAGRGTIVDLGCGNGTVSAWFARRHPDARIVALDAESNELARYEHTRSSLDLGRREAAVRPHTAVSYVPSAAMLVRRGSFSVCWATG